MGNPSRHICDYAAVKSDCGAFFGDVNAPQVFLCISIYFGDDNILRMRECIAKFLVYWSKVLKTTLVRK